jgi:hypothetical protein
VDEEGIDEPNTTANISEKGSCPANDVLGLLAAESSVSSQYCAVRPISPLADVNRKARHDDLSAVEQDKGWEERTWGARLLHTSTCRKMDDQIGTCRELGLGAKFTEVAS